MMGVVIQTPKGNVRLSGPLSPTYHEDMGFPGDPAVKNPSAMQELQETGV